MTGREFFSFLFFTVLVTFPSIVIFLGVRLKMEEVEKKVVQAATEIKELRGYIGELEKMASTAITEEDRKDLVNKFTKEVFDLHKKIAKLQDRVERLEKGCCCPKKVQLNPDTIKAFSIHEGKARVVYTDGEGQRFVEEMTEDEYKRICQKDQE